MTNCSRRLLKILFVTVLTAAMPGYFGLIARAQAVGGGLDCNGWSPISRNVKGAMVCADPHGLNGKHFYDNGWYIGHDEPSAQFYSNQPGSGNQMFWRFNLPKRDPVPNQSGTSVATFELTPAIWFGLSLCDPNSFPQNPCIPDSDRNTGIGLTTDAGSAVLEVQFYAPGWPPFINQLSCDSTHWCAALNIDSWSAISISTATRTARSRSILLSCSRTAFRSAHRLQVNRQRPRLRPTTKLC